MINSNRQTNHIYQRGNSGRSNIRRGSNRSGNPRASSFRSNSYAAWGKQSNYKNTKKYSDTNNKAVIVVLSVILFIGIVAVGAYAYSSISYLYNDDVIIPGVKVDGVDIGGLNREEAFVTLNNSLNERLNQIFIKLNYGDKYWAYDSSILNTSSDISGIIDEALTYGHTGDLNQRRSEAEYIMNNPSFINMSIAYDENAVRQLVESLQDEINVAPIEPSLEFDKDAGKITNIDDTIALLYNPLKYDSTVSVNDSPAEVYIDNDDIYRVNSDVFKTTSGVSGKELDVEATVLAILSDLSDDLIADINVVTKVVEPTLKEDELNEFTSLVYHSKSGLDSSSTYDRDRNVDVALSKFDGMVIMPGETVSFNETTGERLPENGFFLAPGIAADKSLELVYGGGVCQAATIIFNAALMSGMQINDKDSHSWPSYYRNDDYGQEARDAMVNWGTSDLVFTNTTEYPIYFDTYVHWRTPDNATHAYCNVYTKLLPDGQSYSYLPRLIETREVPEVEYITLEDTTKYADQKWTLDNETGLLVYQHVKSRPYKYYEVSQQLLDSSGNILSDTLWYKSQYDEIQGQYYTKPNIEDTESTESVVDDVV